MKPICGAPLSAMESSQRTPVTQGFQSAQSVDSSRSEHLTSEISSTVPFTSALIVLATGDGILERCPDSERRTTLNRVFRAHCGTDSYLDIHECIQHGTVLSQMVPRRGINTHFLGNLFQLIGLSFDTLFPSFPSEPT